MSINGITSYLFLMYYFYCNPLVLIEIRDDKMGRVELWGGYAGHIAKREKLILRIRTKHYIKVIFFNVGGTKGGVTTMLI